MHVLLLVMPLSATPTEGRDSGRRLFWHLQALTALAFSDDDAVLLSGGEDTVACAWLLSDVLDASQAQQGGLQGPPTLHTWCAWFARCPVGRTQGTPHW